MRKACRKEIICSEEETEEDEGEPAAGEVWAEEEAAPGVNAYVRSVKRSFPIGVVFPVFR